MRSSLAALALVVAFCTPPGSLLSQNPAAGSPSPAQESPAPAGGAPGYGDESYGDDSGEHGAGEPDFEDPYDEDYDGDYDEEPAEPRLAKFAERLPPDRDPLSDEAWAELTEGRAYEQEEAPVPEEPASGFEFGEGFLQAVRVLAWIAVVALILGVLVYFVRRGRRRTGVANAGRSYGLTDELLAASESDLESALDRNLREGDFRGAIRYRFGQVLQALRSGGLLRWVPGKTNEEYRRELPDGELREAFGNLARRFAFATYAGREVGERQYRAFAQSADGLGILLERGASRSGRARPGGSGAATRALALAGCTLALTACGEWAETYDPDDDGAYGTELLPGILAAALPEAEVVELGSAWAADGLLEGWDEGAVYVAIGDGLSYADTEADALLAFASAGGEVLLATKEVSNAVLAPFAPASCLEGESVTPNTRVVASAGVRSARGSDLELPAITPREGDNLYARSIARGDSCLASARDLLAVRLPTSYEYDTLTAEESFSFENWSARTEVEPIMARMPYGAGGVTLLSFPLLLTNVYATDSAGRELIEEIVGFLPPEADVVYFDEPRRSPEWVVVEENRPSPSFEFGSPTSAEDNILKHVLRRPPLAAAWYALLVGALIFLALGVKRRQRVVPLVHARRNTTREHLGNVSRLYLASPDNARMARKQLTLFENWSRTRFGLAPLRDAGDGQRFRALQGVDVGLVDAVDRYYHSLERGQGLSNGGLVRLVRILQALRRSAR